MLNFKEHKNRIETPLTGKNLMTIPQLNKGTAFTHEERETFKLLGKLPQRVESLEEQVSRAYAQFSQYDDDLQKHIYLNNLHDKNQVLFYKLCTDYLAQMMPLIYTPCIAKAVQEFSREFRQARGLFIAYEDRDYIEEILDNRTNPEIDLIVVTDGEGVLGIGDQGTGSINIPIGKLMVYTLCGGISPLKTLPIYLDVGTNNPAHLNDPYYLGARHPRISREAYDEFIDKFVNAVQKKFPKAFLHWEDFGFHNARRILDKYYPEICTFNDDIQGTGAVTLAALLAAINKTNTKITDQRVIIFGAGTAGVGIADQIFQAMCREGLSEKEAYDKFWLFNRSGLITINSKDLTPAQQKYARHEENAPALNSDLIHKIKPTILIGCSSKARAFTEEMVKAMAQHTTHPIIFPLSNPTSHAEAIPEDLLKWTEGRALIATGSPFPNVSQCNNSLIFPGLGLGIIASRAKLLTDEMLWTACKTLSQFSGEKLLPDITQAREASFAIAKAVCQTAIDQNLARINFTKDIESYIHELVWQPEYLPLKLVE